MGFYFLCSKSILLCKTTQCGVYWVVLILISSSILIFSSFYIQPRQTLCYMDCHPTVTIYIYQWPMSIIHIINWFENFCIRSSFPLSWNAAFAWILERFSSCNLSQIMNYNFLSHSKGCSSLKHPSPFPISFLCKLNHTA